MSLAIGLVLLSIKLVLATLVVLKLKGESAYP